MKNNKELEKNEQVHIEQINPRTELNDLEKTAILQFELENKIHKEEELSKTQQFKMLNKKVNEEIELPKKKVNLGDTIKLKISDLRAAIDNSDLELPALKPKRSLYDTVIIKLDDFINKKNSLAKGNSKKVTKIEETKKNKKRFHLFKPKDITKVKDLKLNIDSEEFGRQLYNLNRIALNNLSIDNQTKARKYSTLSKLEKIEKVHISKKNYLKYQNKLNKFAINKLYYKLAPKETKKYKLYKYSVIASGFIFVLTSVIIVNWFINGISINRLSSSLREDTTITEVTNKGDLFNVQVPNETPDLSIPIVPEDAPKPEIDNQYSDKKTMYWKYLNTPLSSVDFTELLKENKDTVGWLIVNNTNVNYPVVQTVDNDYYLTHSFDRSYNSAGWVYADFRDNFDVFSNNMVIYAHGRKDKVMFGSLTNTLKDTWYTNLDNQIIQLSTLKYNTMWQIFSIYTIEAESYYITTDFGSEESYAKFLETMKNRSIYDFGVELNTNDKLLTLSTCYNDNGIRLVVQAKLVKIQER